MNDNGLPVVTEFLMLGFALTNRDRSNFYSRTGPDHIVQQKPTMDIWGFSAMVGGETKFSDGQDDMIRWVVERLSRGRDDGGN